MTERQRIDRFAELLDEAAGGRRRHHRRTEVDPDLTPLMETSNQITTLPRPAPSADFRDGLRALLMATIEREGIGVTEAAKAEQAAVRAALAGKTEVVRPVVRPGSGRTRGAIILGVAAGALALSGVSLASTDSVPGDTLYSVKRSSEQAQLVLAGSDAGRGHLHLEFAMSRQVEAGQVPGAAIGRVLDEMDGEARDGTRLLLSAAWQDRDGPAVESVNAFVSQQRDDLTQLRLVLPGAADHLRESLDLLRDIETRANQGRRAVLSGC